ncbi:excinuclease ABC subunit UvrA [Ruminococcus sp. OA3]|uniref:ATP-binding cassette domain-containing protein n=1 Tax=Ruminococcus sp. OA3 TaxID=2914164 RepID=UPI001F05BD41|nr:excinuclease ABC subunit UvrA [Ruminococcus sp. OA3]MCH1983505.1 excinuclease ABC subunit UvrA [Ruminococcus sp. OA3]
MDHIKITGAHEGCLKNISLEIPKHKLVVFTGLSGSGKSTLLVDVLFQECQRQYLEAMSFQGIQKPKVERIQGASPAIVISQTDANKNIRSTVGTQTDLYTDLRMIFEKLGVRSCPHCSAIISSADCKEETEKNGSDFHVYMYCSECGRRMDKITRTYFSFNTKEGACPTCDGLGKMHMIKRDYAVDETLTLEDGAVRYWEKQYGRYQTSVLYKAFAHYSLPIPIDIPVHQFSSMQKTILYEGVEGDTVKQAYPDLNAPENAASGKFEGVLPILWRRLSEKGGDVSKLSAYFDVTECPDCKGERLCKLSRSITVNGTRLPELSFFSLEKLHRWITELTDSLSEQQLASVNAYLLDIKTKLGRLINVGLGYLSLDRQTISLSGGELQRLRLAAALDSDLSGVIYILDEPTAGLHPQDTAGLMTILKKLRDLGNTVLVIEHDVDVMESADYIIDMGPGSGRYGGEIIAAGTLEDLKQQKDSVTGSYLRSPVPGKTVFRKAAGSIQIENADKFNLKQVSVSLPIGCLTSVTGPSGSGKSTLVFEVLAKGLPDFENNRVSGTNQFDRIIKIEQSAIAKMKRSNTATYSEVYTDIRSVFANTQAARKAGLSAKHFSFNTPGGRCENCEGLGYVDNNMLFFANTDVVCPVCGGMQFQSSVLAVKYRGVSIKDVLDLSVDEAREIFTEHPKIADTLTLLQDVGLGYLLLGQPLTTLSGGECQRLKLARELTGSRLGKHSLYLMDEPTTGLHPKDVEHFLVLLNRLADNGNTVVVVEHNQQMIRNSDWVIDLGPAGGDRGGYIIFEGTPEELKRSGCGYTAKFM